MNIKAVLKGTTEQLKVIYEVLDNPDMYEGVVKITSKEMIRMVSVNLEEAYKQIEIEEEQENE
jgi:hypothetical protein